MSIGQSVLAADNLPDTSVPVENKSVTELQAVTVTGAATQQPVEPNTDQLQGKRLQQYRDDTLGQTLSNMSGVSNASFGPGVGIPVIRGLTGSRIRLLQNGIGSHDASSLSPDHAATAEALFAEEIQVMRGTEAIRYGGNAAGGVVNVKDHRIPERIPRNYLSGFADNRFDTNGQGTTSAFRLNLGKDWLALSLGGFFLDRSNTRIPGTAINTRVLSSADDDIPTSRKKIPNSDNRNLGGFVGASWLGESAMVGLAISHTNNRYGIPPGGHEHEHEDHADEHDAHLSDVRIAMRQTRYDFKSEWFEPLTGIERIGFRYGQVDYRHTEKEAGGGTRFKNNTGEGRFELDHHWLPALTGTFGAQWTGRNFSALGDENFIPKTRQDLLGFYTTQQYAWNNWLFSGGLRFEHSRIHPKAGQLESMHAMLPIDVSSSTTKHRMLSASVAAQWQPRQDLTVQFELNHSKRAPDIQELLSLGPHLSTHSFDIGNPQLNPETMNSVELGLDWQKEQLRFRTNGYYRRTNRFIYQRNTGLFYDHANEAIQAQCSDGAACLPVLAYDQRHAEFIGYEAEAGATFYQLPGGKGDVSLTLFSDYVRARFVQGGHDDVPRIPPLRFGAELGAGNAVWNTALRYTRATAQSNPGDHETNTRGYHLLTASADYQLKASQRADFWLFVRGTNLLNEEIRNATSFLRNYAPEPGRSFTLGVRATF